jgi:predicted alpha/beta-hydrolase family hydrolase
MWYHLKSNPTGRSDSKSARRHCGARLDVARAIFLQVAEELLALDVEAARITCVKAIAVDTPHGEAKAHLHPADDPRGALVLGHGAGGGVTAPDLVAVTAVARSEGVSVALVEQPYRVAGRRSPAPARQLDAAWTAVVDHLKGGKLRGLGLVVGGRSLGARVACRTVEATGAVGVLCLAFPLRAPRRSGKAPAQDRLSELDAVTVPTLVVQGERDPFGMPPAGARRTVTVVPGNHSLRTDVDAVAAAVRTWLPGVVDRAATAATRG